MPAANSTKKEPLLVTPPAFLRKSPSIVDNREKLGLRSRGTRGGTGINQWPKSITKMVVKKPMASDNDIKASSDLFKYVGVGLRVPSSQVDKFESSLRKAAHELALIAHADSNKPVDNVDHAAIAVVLREKNKELNTKLEVQAMMLQQQEKELEDVKEMYLHFLDLKDKRITYYRKEADAVSGLVMQDVKYLKDLYKAFSVLVRDLPNNDAPMKRALLVHQCLPNWWTAHATHEAIKERCGITMANQAVPEVLPEAYRKVKDAHPSIWEHFQLKEDGQKK